MSVPAVTPAPATSFTAEQKEYLQGFMAGAHATGALNLSVASVPSPLTPNPSPGSDSQAEPLIHGTPLADLCQQERWKHDENPLDSWERLNSHADQNKNPDAEHNYRFRTFGLFHVSPAQDSYMMRLRIPAGEISSHQFKGLADLASEFGGGYAHLTTRANLQIREIKPKDTVKTLTRVQDLGLTARGSGADNIRNITANPDSGFARDELLDVRPHAKALHHYILNHRDLYGLPRKFNVAFDNGGSICTAADTNDIGFYAYRVTAERLKAEELKAEKNATTTSTTTPASTAFSLPPSAFSSPAPGVYFRVLLGGISGHKDLARDTGLLIHPSEAVAVAAAMLRVFLEHGDRTDRKKARLKYVLDKHGFDWFLEKTQAKLAFPLARLPLAACEPRRPSEKHSWVGVRKQAQPGLNSIGVFIPVGRMSPRQMHALADLASTYGKSELRLTVWQNLLIPHIPDAFVPIVERTISRIGFTTTANPATAGIIACTGNKGCKYSSADTKGSAVSLIKHLSTGEHTDTPVNIHITGCANSCAQHYCGDIGFISTKLSDGTEGYHMVVGGGMDNEAGIARELFKGLRSSEINTTVEKILATYRAKRASGETLVEWSRRHSIKDLQELLSS